MLSLVLFLSVLQLWNSVYAMAPLSVPRKDFNDWAPRNTIQAAYYNIHKESLQVQEARFVINATIPTVNIDNFPHIAAVNCLEDNSTILLHFTDPEAAQNAYKQWYSERASKNMSLYVNHHYNCFGSDFVQARHVNSMYLEGQSLRVDTHWLNHTTTYGNMEVHLGDATPQQTQQILLHKRDKSVFKQYEFNVNYENGSVWNSNFTLVNFTQNVILQFPRISAYCIDCYARGNATFDLYMRTQDSKVVDYKIRTRGDFHVESGFDFHFPKSSDKRMVSFGLLYSPVGPEIYVPGLFYLGLSASFGGSFTYASNQKFKMQFGFETREAFDILIEPNRESSTFSLSRIFHVPKVTRLDTGVPATKHHPFSVSNSTDLIYSLHFGPLLDLTLNALQIDLVSMKLSFDNALGLETLTGKAKFCTNVDREYEMNRRHTFNFDVKVFGYSFSMWRMGFSWAGFALWRKHFEIWATPYMPYICDFCADSTKCPPGNLNLNRTVPKKTGLDAFS